LQNDPRHWREQFIRISSESRRAVCVVIRSIEGLLRRSPFRMSNPHVEFMSRAIVDQWGMSKISHLEDRLETLVKKHFDLIRTADR
jgi:hypothetical protein